MGDREHTAGDESAQRDDRKRHMHVEELLQERLFGVERGVEEDQCEGHRHRGQRAKGQHGGSRTTQPPSLASAPSGPERSPMPAARRAGSQGQSSTRKSNRAYAISPNNRS